MPRILSGSILEFSREDDARPVYKSSKLRTAGIAAGGAGLAYGGVKIGKAATQVADSFNGLADQAKGVLVHAHQTAANTNVVTKAVRASGTLLPAWWRNRVLRKMGSRGVVVELSKVQEQEQEREVRFQLRGMAGVAQDRYKKQIRDADSGRALRDYRNAGVAGGIAGAVLRKAGSSRLKGIGVGAVAGIGAQAVVRAGTAQTKDSFGDRSPAGRKVDMLAPVAIAGGAAIAGRKKLMAAARLARRKMAGAGGSVVGAVAKKVTRGSMARGVWEVAKGVAGFSAGSQIGDLRFQKTGQAILFGAYTRARVARGLVHGGALAGGIAVADAATSAAMPDHDMTAGKAAAHGLKKGALYGGGTSG